MAERNGTGPISVRKMGQSGMRDQEQYRSMPLATLVIVSGLPATGKTTLANALGDSLSWPVFHKDHFKELLFESRVDPAAAVDRTASRDFGKQSMHLLYAIARELIHRGVNCITEAYFHPELAAPELTPLTSSARVIQLHCAAADAVMVSRYRARYEAGERHEIHFDATMVGELEQRINSAHRDPIPLDTTRAGLIEVRSDDGFTPSVAEIAATIRAFSDA